MSEYEYEVDEHVRFVDGVGEEHTGTIVRQPTTPEPWYLVADGALTFALSEEDMWRLA